MIFIGYDLLKTSTVGYYYCQLSIELSGDTVIPTAYFIRSIAVDIKKLPGGSKIKSQSKDCRV